HDLQFKIRHIKRFLSQKNKAKVTVVFRGREISYTEPGLQVLQRVIDEVGDLGVVEQPPKLEGRNMVMILAPKL
ncbi:MAG: translation initiation factor IF-3, partial [Deltaproteobacteria bacterium]